MKEFFILVVVMTFGGWLIWRGYVMRYKLQGTPSHGRVVPDLNSWLRFNGLTHIVMGLGVFTIVGLHFVPEPLQSDIAPFWVVGLACVCWLFVRRLKRYEQA